MDKPTKSTVGSNSQGNPNPNNSGGWGSGLWNLGNSALQRATDFSSALGSSLFGYDVESEEKALETKRASNKKTDTIDNVFGVLSVYIGGEFSDSLKDVCTPSSYYGSPSLDECVCDIIDGMVDILIQWGGRDLLFFASLKERISGFSFSDLEKAGVDISDLDQNLIGKKIRAMGERIEAQMKHCVEKIEVERKDKIIGRIYGKLVLHFGGEFSDALDKVFPNLSKYRDSNTTVVCVNSLVCDIVHELIKLEGVDFEFLCSLKARLDKFSADDVLHGASILEDERVTDLDSELGNMTQDMVRLVEGQKRRVLIEKLKAKIAGNLDAASEAELNKRVDMVIVNFLGSEADFLRLVIVVIVDYMTESFGSNVQRLELLVQILKNIGSDLNHYLVKIDHNADWSQDLLLVNIMTQLIETAAVAKERAVVNEAAAKEKVIDRVTVHITGNVKEDNPDLKKEIEDFFVNFEGNDVDRLIGLTLVCVCYVIKRCPNYVDRLELLAQRINEIIGELECFYAPGDTDLDLSKDQSVIKQLKEMVAKVEEARKAALSMLEQAKKGTSRVASEIVGNNWTECDGLNKQIGSLLSSFRGSEADFLLELTRMCVGYVIVVSSSDVARLDALSKSLIKIQKDLDCFFGDDLDLSEHPTASKQIEEMLLEVVAAGKKADVKDNTKKKILRVGQYIAQQNETDGFVLYKEAHKLLDSFEGDYGNFFAQLICICTRYTIKTESTNVACLEALVSRLNLIEVETFFDTGDDLDLSGNKEVCNAIQKMIDEVKVAHQKAIVFAAREAQAPKERAQVIKTKETEGAKEITIINQMAYEVWGPSKTEAVRAVIANVVGRNLASINQYTEAVILGLCDICKDDKKMYAQLAKSVEFLDDKKDMLVIGTRLRIRAMFNKSTEPSSREIVREIISEVCNSIGTLYDDKQYSVPVMGVMLNNKGKIRSELNEIQRPKADMGGKIAEKDLMSFKIKVLQEAVVVFMRTENLNVDILKELTEVLNGLLESNTFSMISEAEKLKLRSFIDIVFVEWRNEFKKRREEVAAMVRAGACPIDDISGLSVLASKKKLCNGRPEMGVIFDSESEITDLLFNTVYMEIREAKYKTYGLEIIISSLSDLENSYFKGSSYEGRVRERFKDREENERNLFTFNKTVESQMICFEWAIQSFIDRRGMPIEALDALLVKLEELFALEVFDKIPENVNKAWERGDPSIRDKKDLRQLVHAEKKEKIEAREKWLTREGRR